MRRFSSCIKLSESQRVPSPLVHFTAAFHLNNFNVTSVMPHFQQLKISRSTREDRISPAEGLIESEGPSATRPVCNNALQFDTGGDCSQLNLCDAKFSTVGNLKKHKRREYKPSAAVEGRRVSSLQRLCTV